MPSPDASSAAPLCPSTPTNPFRYVFTKFFREHQWPSFLEYGEYPYVSCEEIKKALKLKAAFSDVLDQMQ